MTQVPAEPFHRNVRRAAPILCWLVAPNGRSHTEWSQGTRIWTRRRALQAGLVPRQAVARPTRVQAPRPLRLGPLFAASRTACDCRILTLSFPISGASGRRPGGGRSIRTSRERAVLGAVDSTLRVVRARWVSTGGEPLAGTRAGAPARVLVVERLRRATERHRRRAVRNSLGLAVALVSVYQGPGIPVWMCLSWWRARARFSALYCLLCPSVVLCISLHVQVRLNAPRACKTGRTVRLYSISYKVPYLANRG